MKEYKKYLEDRHSEYVEQRKGLDGYAFQMGSQHDQWVLKLSGGALGLSVTFLEKIVPHPAAGTNILLFISWGSLAASLLAALYGIHYSHLAINRQIILLDSEYDQFRKTTSEEFPSGKEDPNRCKSENEFVTKSKNWSFGARSSTILGVALFCLFCFVNTTPTATPETSKKFEITISADDAILKLLEKYKENKNDQSTEKANKLTGTNKNSDRSATTQNPDSKLHSSNQSDPTTSTSAEKRQIK